MRKITVLLVLLAFAVGVQAQDTTYWKKGGDYALNFSDVAFSNWAAGGDNAQNINSFMNLFASYAKDKIAWDNTLNLSYGLSDVAGKGYRKSDDKIDFSSKFGYKANEKLFYAALGTFKSQFTAGYEYTDQDKNVISNLMAPGYFTFGIGIDYKPSKCLSIYFSPVTNKMTFVNIEGLRTKYGLEADKSTRYEFGGLAKIVFRKDIVKNVTLESKLELFSNYLKNPQNIDIDWQNALTMKVNKYLSASILTHLLYDDDIDINADADGKQVGIQFTRTFGVGFMYKF
jgi:hypothetical protein